MQKKVAIFGSAINEDADNIGAQIKELGETLADKEIVLITGACEGVPYKVALVAYQRNKAEIWGFSPSRNYQEQVESTPGDDNSIYSKLIYIPKDYEFADNIYVCRKYRNVTTTATCDAGIIVSGRWGTMNEFTNLNDMGKVIGILTGTGGIADLLKDLYQKISKPSKAVLIFNSSPKELVEQVIAEIEKRSN